MRTLSTVLLGATIIGIEIAGAFAAHAAPGWQDRVGALWQERLTKIADTDAIDGDPVKQIEAWFGRQYNRRGGFCCSKADAYPFDGPYEFTANGGVTFQWTDKAGETFTVDVSPDQLLQPKMQTVGDREVVVDGNPTGGAVIWYTGELSAGWNPNLYCFAPGTLN